MKVAIIGSRDYPLPNLVRAYVFDKMSLDDILVSGRGGIVDITAEKAAEDRGMVTDIYPADWDKLGLVAGFERNKPIARVCERAVAFWDLRSGGTKDTLEQLRIHRKPYIIYGPDGRRV
jgi:hypothetical protein